MVSHLAFAESLDISERQFLLKEFGISLAPFSSIYAEKSIPKTLTLILNSPSGLIEQVLALDSKLIIFIVGNEKYERQDVLKLLDSKKTLRIYIPYSPRKPTFINLLFMLIGNLIDGGLIFNAPSGGMLRTLANGFRKWKNTIELTNRFEVESIPLGYTNRFVAELQELGLDVAEEDSLFQRAPLLPLEAKAESISFCGTRDSWCRDLAISHLRRTIAKGSLNGLVLVDSKWGGESRPGGLYYCKSILESKTVLCPPGYSSNFTFRFWESLLLGSFPICLPLSAQDWHLWQPSSWDIRRRKLSAYSWKLQLSPKRIKSNTIEEYELMISLALAEGHGAILAVREFLSSVGKT